MITTEEILLLMAEGKNSFILYADDIHTVEQLTDGEAGQLFKTILRYVNDMDPVPDERIVALAFEPIKQRLKRDLKNWEEIRAKRAEAGRAGAQKKAEQTEAKSANADTCQQDEANQAVSDSVSVSVSEKKDIVPTGTTPVSRIISESEPSDIRKLKAEYSDLVTSEPPGPYLKDRLLPKIRDFVAAKRPTYPEPYLDLWNLFALKYGVIKGPQRLTEDRRRKFNSRIKEPAFDFVAILQVIRGSRFLKGENDRGWKVDIDFILNSEKNYTKILEGKYE